MVLRTVGELVDLADRNPFLRAGTAADGLHVAFLADAPLADRVARLDPGRSPGDAFEVCGREVFLHCPNGLARTKLTNAYFDATLGTTSTMRNWRTVLALLSMAKKLKEGADKHPQSP